MASVRRGCAVIFLFCFYTHHHREDDGEKGGFEDPEDGQTDQLDEGEQMHPSQRHVPQEGEVWLVLGWHQVELDALPELDHGRSIDRNDVLTLYIK